MPSYILVGVICVSLLSIYLSAIAGHRTKLDGYIRCFLAYLALHAAHAWIIRVYFPDNMRLDYYAPYGLLYGPLLYFAYQIAKGIPLRARQVLLHALPFLVFVACYFLWIGFPALFEHRPRLLGLSLYSVLSLSFLSYAVWALFIRSDDGETGHNEEVRMISMMAMILALLAVIFSVFTYSGLLSGNARSQFKGSLIFLTMLCAAIILFSYIVKRVISGSSGTDQPDTAVTPTSEQFTGNMEPATPAIRYQKSAIPQDLLENYAAELRRVVEEEQAYLDDRLSLASLAQRLKIPKHHLSQVFSLHIGKNFNTYINEQRVKHATMLMYTHPEMGIAEIQLNSGFAAKTSFNRYFKHFQKCTPTEYRNQLIEKGLGR